MRRRTAAVLFGALLPSLAFAQPPAPINATAFAFPGGVPSPLSGTSAGVGLADRWLGDEPFDNPAVAPRRALVAAPLLLHISRQDLIADNREFSDQGTNFDFAGAWGALAIRRLAIAAYVAQPELRLEDNAYLVGRANSVGPSASVTHHASTRELRYGLGVSLPAGRARLGAALEWTERSDDYAYHEESGAPTAGDQEASFSGGAAGGQFGARAEWPWGKRSIELGAGARYLPRLDVDGTQQLDLALGSSSSSVHASRAAAWEGGLGVRVRTSENFRVLASAGGRDAQAWEGFDVTSGTRFEWKIAGEFHAAGDPWTIRFGGGQEQQDGVPEPRDGVFALGFSWQWPRVSLDAGLTHRTIARNGEPNSYDDRALLSLAIR
jgi:hypothetical protein